MFSAMRRVCVILGPFFAAAMFFMVVATGTASASLSAPAVLDPDAKVVVDAVVLVRNDATAPCRR